MCRSAGAMTWMLGQVRSAKASSVGQGKPELGHDGSCTRRPGEFWRDLARPDREGS